MKSDMKYGPGTFKWDNESIYNGEFIDDYPNNEGEIVHKDLSRYIGRWKNEEA